MEIRNIPTDWDEPHIIVGYGMKLSVLWDIVSSLRDEEGMLCIIDRPDAYVEFFPLKEE